MKGKKCTFRFTKVSEVEVFLLLESIDCKKSFGNDKIHPLLLSSAANISTSDIHNKLNS